MFKIRRYATGDKEAWNRFVAESKNGTFLFDRNYMDYHSDRFADFSLLIADAADRLIGLLPANRVEDRLVSHGGLTYGGIVSDREMTTAGMIDLFVELRRYLVDLGVRWLDYKTIPSIYHRLPAEEDRYALFLNKAALVRRDVLSVIEAGSAAPLQERRLRGIRKAEKAGVTVEPGHQYEEFWQILAENLLSVHNRRPVHSLEEISLLSRRFPDNIQLFLAKRDGEALGGVVMYLTGATAHAQYIASNAEGRRIGALDLLFQRLVERFSRIRYFDFGISNESDGRQFNRGLLDFKEGFGARAVVHDHYCLDLS
jgi:hypothetical protein